MWPKKDVAAAATGEIRVMAEGCSTCIFRPDGLQQRAGVLADITRRIPEREGHVVCHEIYMDAPADTPGAICQGFVDATGDDSVAIRFARALGLMVEIRPAGR